MTVEGSGTVYITNTNSFSGTTVISGGTLQIGKGGATGSLGNSTAVTDNATLAFDLSGAQTFSNVVSGNGAVAVNDAAGSALTVSGNNSPFSGTTSINSGTVYVTNSNSLGATSGGAVTVAAGATLDIGGVPSGTLNFGVKTFNIAGAGVAGSLGAIQDNGGAKCATGTANQLSAFENITLTANATIGGYNVAFTPGTGGNNNDGRFDIGRVTAGAMLNLGGYTLTKDGADFLNLATNLTVNFGATGNMVVTSGVLGFDTNTTVQSASDYVIFQNNTAGQFFNTTTGNITAPIIVSGNNVWFGQSDPGKTSTIDSSFAINGKATFAAQNGATTGGLIIAGNISDVTAAVSNALSTNVNLPVADDVAAGAGSVRSIPLQP